MHARDYVYLTVQEMNQECSAHEFGCNDGSCIPNVLKCNNKYDCADSSDESDCESSSTSEDEVELGGSLQLDCETSNQSYTHSNKPAKWFRMNGNQPTGQFSDNILIEGKTLKIINIRAENAGVYRCMIDGVFKDYIVTIKG